MLAGSMLQRLNSLFVGGSCRNLYTAVTLEAARKGTRAKAEAKKKARKRAAIKQEVIPFAKRMEMEKFGSKVSPRHDDSGRGLPVDDVFFRRCYRWIIYPFAEALELLRETHHPTQLNNPKGACIARIELSMTANKKNKYIDAFSNVISLPHPFETNEARSVLALCKDDDMVAMARDMNITAAFGPEAIQLAIKGEIKFNEFEYIVCHSSLLPDMISIHSLLKKKFPAIKNGTAGVDMEAIINRFTKGVKYEVEKDKYDHDFAKVEIKIGTLDMKAEDLEENLKTILLDIEDSRPKARSESAITLVNLLGESSTEPFKLDHSMYFPKKTELKEEDLDDDEDVQLKN